MADIDVIKKELGLAQRAINTAINTVHEWGRASVGNVPHTVAQRDDLIATFDASLADAESAIAAAKAERNS